MPERVRIDRWLWAARFYRTRGLAVDAIEGGKIEVNGERCKRAKLVQAGDRVRVRMGPFEHLLTVLDVSERRGPASEAVRLYSEDEQSRKSRESLAAHMRAMRADSWQDSGRPTKKDRRDIERLRERR